MLRADAKVFVPEKKRKANENTVKIPDERDPVCSEKSKLTLEGRSIRRPERHNVNKVRDKGLSL